jgi:hypothetical protein
MDSPNRGLTKFGEPINPVFLPVEVESVLAMPPAHSLAMRSAGSIFCSHPQVQGLPYRLTNPTNCYAMEHRFLAGAFRRFLLTRSGGPSIFICAIKRCRYFDVLGRRPARERTTASEGQRPR